MNILFTLFALVIFNWNMPVLAAGSDAKKEPSIQQPADQTDIFAIPLDEDEESQNEELEKLEHPKK